MKIVYSPRAKIDVRDISHYSQKQWGSDKARAYTRELRGAIETLADNPNIAMRCEEVRSGYRRFVFKDYSVFLQHRCFGHFHHPHTASKP